MSREGPGEVAALRTLRVLTYLSERAKPVDPQRHRFAGQLPAPEFRIEAE